MLSGLRKFRVRLCPNSFIRSGVVDLRRKDVFIMNCSKGILAIFSSNVGVYATILYQPKLTYISISISHKHMLAATNQSTSCMQDLKQSDAAMNKKNILWRYSCELRQVNTIVHVLSTWIVFISMQYMFNVTLFFGQSEVPPIILRLQR